MRWFFLFFLLFIDSKAFPYESLRALIACDTISNLKTASEKDLATIKTALQKISHSCNLHLKTEVLSDRSLSTENILSWIKTIEKSPESVVFFYYSGHGFRNQEMQTSLPYLFFPGRQESFSPDLLFRRLAATKSHLVIIILDCCNSLSRINIPMQRVFSKSESPFSPTFPGIKTLFIKNQGHIVAIGSSPGESAFAYDSGSLFTNSFVQSLFHESQSEEASWARIFERTAALCSPTQRPLSFLNISPVVQKSKKSPKVKIVR